MTKRKEEGVTEKPKVSKREKITRFIPDDEIVAYGNFHMERMDSGHIWFHVNGETFRLLSKRKISIVSDEKLQELNP